MKGIAIGLGFLTLGAGFYQLTTQRLSGDWEGESKCVNLQALPGCRDEHVIYHIASVKGKDDVVKVNADRITDKKPVAMGELEFKVDLTRKMMTDKMSMGGRQVQWTFYIKDDKIDGTLSMLPGHEIARKVSLKRNTK